jgi:hypothetical protein
MLEFFSYIKDYNDLMIINNYVKYEIESNGGVEIANEKYKVVLNNGDSYTISLKRNSVFNFEKYKIIKYNGIVD